MAEFTFNCPHCDNPLEAQEEWRGQETNCPYCGVTLSIPLKLSLTPVSPIAKDGILLKRGRFIGLKHDQLISIMCSHCGKEIQGCHLDVFCEELECPYCKGKVTYSAINSSNAPIVIIQNETKEGQHILLTAYGISDTEVFEAFKVFIFKSQGEIIPQTDEYQWARLKGAPYGINAYASKNQSTVVNLRMDAMHMSFMRALGDMPNVYDIYPRLIETIWKINNIPGYGGISPFEYKTRKLCLTLGKVGAFFLLVAFGYLLIALCVEELYLLIFFTPLTIGSFFITIGVLIFKLSRLDKK